jgi:hypothetical protein
VQAHPCICYIRPHSAPVEAQGKVAPAQVTPLAATSPGIVMTSDVPVTLFVSITSTGGLPGGSFALQCGNSQSSTVVIAR